MSTLENLPGWPSAMQAEILAVMGRLDEVIKEAFSNQQLAISNSKEPRGFS
jgi:hypothetical protein